MVIFNIVSFLLALTSVNISFTSYQAIIPIVLLCCCLLLAGIIVFACPEVEMMERNQDKEPEELYEYSVPFMPFPPLFGIIINFFLIAQLSWLGLLFIFVYACLAIVFYLSYGINHSIGNRTKWASILQNRYNITNDDILERSFIKDRNNIIQPQVAEFENKSEATDDDDPLLISNDKQ
jgi:hypothetical protein